MSDMLQSAAAQLADYRRNFASIPVEYRPLGGEAIQNIPAQRDTTDYATANSDGVMVTTQAKDFIINAADMDVEPQPGDRIIAGETVYTVLDIGDGCFHWLDLDTARRIHTKDMGDEA